MSLLYPPGASAPVTAESCCQECAQATSGGGSPYGLRRLGGCSGGGPDWVPGSGGVNFWAPMNDGVWWGVYEYFQAACAIWTSPYADSTGATAYDGTPLDPDAPADQTQFWGLTNAQAAAGRMGLYVQWMFFRVPELVEGAGSYEGITALYQGPTAAENFFRAFDGVPLDDETIYPLEHAGSAFLNMPNHGQWKLVHGVREPAVGGFPSGGWQWNEWYVNVFGLLLPGDDGTGGRWAGGDEPTTTAAWACLPNQRLQSIGVTTEGWAVYG